MSWWDTPYSWASNNPLDVASLGLGALGTGFGIWNQYQAGQQFERAQREALLRNQERQRLAEQFASMGPGAFAPNFSKAQLAARYFRPASQFMQMQGMTDGGAYRQALADAAVKAEFDRLQMGNQIYQSRLGALGYGQPAGPMATLPASGNTGALGGALQNLMLMRALRGQGGGQQQQPYGQAWGGAFAGGDNFDRTRGNSSMDYDVPAWNLQSSWPQSLSVGSSGLGAGAGPGDGRFGMNPMSFGGSNATSFDYPVEFF